MNKIIGLIIGLMLVFPLSLKASEHLSEKSVEELIEMVNPLWELVGLSDEVGQSAQFYGFVSPCDEKEKNKLIDKLTAFESEFLRSFLYVAELAIKGESIEEEMVTARMLIESQVKAIDDSMKECLEDVVVEGQPS